MESKKLFIVSFFINFIFSMLTTLLSLIVFNINHNATDINYIMITFISSLLLTRLIFFKNILSARMQIIIGSVIFATGFLILVLISNSMFWMFFDALLFGISIGMIPPAILLLLSEGKNRDFNLGVYNAIVAVASILSPIIGEKIYNINHQLLFIVWFILALFMAITTILLKKTLHQSVNLEILLITWNRFLLRMNFRLHSSFFYFLQYHTEQ